MASHAEEQHSNQNIALSLSDHSFWCYACDDYITTLQLETWLRDVCESRLSGDEESLADKGKAPVGQLRASGYQSSEESLGDNGSDVPTVVATPASVAAMLAQGQVKQIVVVAGAGISTSAVCVHGYVGGKRGAW